MVALEAESWTWYALTWLVVIARLMSRRILRGSVKKLQIDDAITILIMITDTVLIVCMNIVSKTSSNLINPAEDVDLTPAEIEEREYGSKMVLVVEQMQIITIWLVKACLLVMYGRLTMSLKQNVAVKVVAVYVAVGFVVMEILYLAVWCRPFTQYWAVPPDNGKIISRKWGAGQRMLTFTIIVQCSAATNHLITNAVLNISSDIMIILIPMPVFLEARLPVKKKLILCGVFGLGLFTILSAILNKYYSFSQPFGLEWTYWYIRESSTAILAANLPFIWTLLQRTFNLRSFDYRSRDRTGSATATGAGSRFRSSARHNTLRSHATTDDEEAAVIGRGGRPARDVLAELDEIDEDNGSSRFGRSDSQERINKKTDAYDLLPLKIYQQREVRITTTRAPTPGGTDPSSTAVSPSSPPPPAYTRRGRGSSETDNESGGSNENGGGKRSRVLRGLGKGGGNNKSSNGKSRRGSSDDSDAQSDSTEAIVHARNPTVTTIT